MKLTTLANQIAEDTVRSANEMPSTFSTLLSELKGLPGAQHFEPVRGGGATSLWCWRHEREVVACIKADHNCLGEAITLNDPTGEAAVAYDAARADRLALERHLGIIRRSLDRILDIQASRQSNRVVNDRAGIGECDGCRRYCDGVKDNRLRPVGDSRFCNQCRMRLVRGKAS